MLDDCGRSPNQIWRVYAREEKLERGSGSILLQEIFQFRVPEMPFPAFFAGHFHQISRKENAVGATKGTFFSFSPHYNVSCRPFVE